MFATVTLLTLVNSVSGTPYISGGDSPGGTDCSGLVSWVTNAASGRPIYGDRFNTGNIESALRARGFQHGTQPGALVVGWNSGHTAATLPDGTPVSSGESGGVKVGGGGAYQKQFTHHMFLQIARAARRARRGAPGHGSAHGRTGTAAAGSVRTASTPRGSVRTASAGSGPADGTAPAAGSIRTAPAARGSVRTAPAACGPADGTAAAARGSIRTAAGPDRCARLTFIDWALR
jgi:hypothetical protein